MSLLLRVSPRNQLKRSVSCVCFSRDDWRNPNRMAIGVDVKQSNRTFSRTSFTAKKKSNYYKDLGLSRHATARQIKDAYYELSKKFHPDKNKGSDMASERFREIKDAYEVLGNHSKKRRYDNDIGGIVQQPKTDSSSNEIVVKDAQPEDDAQTKFYTQHMKRQMPPTMADRPSVRAFDADLGKQVSESFTEQKLASEKYSQKDSEMDSNYERSLGILVGFLIIIALVVGIIKHNDDWQFEKMIEVNKVKKK